MIALQVMFDPATHMSCLGIRTGQERCIFLREPMRPPDFEPIHQAEAGWERLPAFSLRVGIAAYPGIHPGSLDFACGAKLLEIGHIVEIVAPQLRLDWIIPVDTVGVIYCVVQERQGCPLYARGGRQKRDFGRLYTPADSCVLYGCRPCRHVS